MDNNKTALTHKVTSLAYFYLESIGCKPIETEVPVAPSWTADIASYCFPTQTEWRKAKWNKRFAQKGEYTYDAFSRWRTKYGQLLTILVEVKTAWADLASDIERKFSCDYPPAHLFYLACPKSLWDKYLEATKGKRGNIDLGGIITSEDGEKVLSIVPSYIYPQNPGDVSNFIAQVGIRRHHRTAYKTHRELMKNFMVQESEERRTMRINHMMRSIVQYLTGKGWMAEFTKLEDALKSSGCRLKIDDKMREYCREIDKLKIKFKGESNEKN